MRKVDYVLFSKELTFTIMRGGEQDYMDLASGEDRRYSSVHWDLKFDEGISCVVITCTDTKTKEKSPTWLVPASNCRQLRIEEDAVIVRKDTDGNPTKSRTII